MPRSHRHHALLLSSILAAGCPGTANEPATRKGDAKPGAESKPDTKPESKPDTKLDARAEPKPDAAKMGRVLPGPLPIDEMIGHAPAEVEAKLGDPLGKGESRTSCVRYVPERTWFKCTHARQRYADPTDKFKAIGVEFEDGKASALAFDGPKGEGPFEPNKALAFVGLELPGEPKLEEPEPGTKVYSWFNASARLLIQGRQYRVQVSTVADDWARSKVELILNDPLSPDELSRKVD